MAAEGWWSGDLDVRRPAKDLELLMEADDLHVVELITWPNGKDAAGQNQPLGQARSSGSTSNRYYHLSAGVDARAGGTLLFFNLPRAAGHGGLQGRSFRRSKTRSRAAKQQRGAWVDARRPSAGTCRCGSRCGKLDSIQLANSNLGRKTAVNNEAGGKPRDTLLLSGAEGNGRWSESIYYHLLNCGLRIPPTAGSGSGTWPNPLGYNRMYVHVDGEFTLRKMVAGRASRAASS